jgi:alkylation response protein AidB-like acyl-CoA dehydrogenase
MISLALHEGTEELLTVVRDFAESRIRAHAADAEAAQAAPVGLAEELHRMGVVPAIAEQFGGQGVPDPVDTLLVAERLAYGDGGVALELLSSGQAANFIAMAGSPSQQRRYLTEFAQRPGLGGNVQYYEGFGRGPTELATRAVRSAEGWTLHGRKAAVVRQADVARSVVVATTEDGEPVAFVFEPEQLRRQTTFRDDQVTGKLGVRAARTGILDLDGVPVPDEQRLAGEHPLSLHRAIALFRLQLPAVALGIGAAALDYACDYTSERIAFGRPVIQNQGVAFPLVDNAMSLDAARLAMIALASEIAELDDPAEIHRRTTLLVQQTLRASVDTTRVAVNSLGGHGYITDHPVERWYRAASTLAAVDFDPLAIDSEVI